MWDIPSSIGTAGYLLDAARIGQGVDNELRVGRKVNPLTLRLNGVLHGGQSNTAVDDSINTVRLILFTGAPNLSAAAAATAWSLNKPGDPARMGGCYSVLLDVTLVLVSPGRDSTGYLPAARHVNYVVSLRQALPELMFSGSDGTTNHTGVYLFALSDSSAMPNPGFVSGGLTIDYLDG